MIDLECEFRYESAHWLTKVPSDHQCSRLHGHSYHLTVVVRGPVRDDGFVCDFADIKNVVNPIIKLLDHHTLNDIDGLGNPTVENQLLWLWKHIHLPGLSELRLRETSNNSAVYRGEPS